MVSRQNLVEGLYSLIWWTQKLFVKLKCILPDACQRFNPVLFFESHVLNRQSSSGLFFRSLSDFCWFNMLFPTTRAPSPTPIWLTIVTTPAIHTRKLVRNMRHIKQLDNTCRISLPIVQYVECLMQKDLVELVVFDRNHETFVVSHQGVIVPKPAQKYLFVFVASKGTCCCALSIHWGTLIQSQAVKWDTVTDNVCIL